VRIARDAQAPWHAKPRIGFPFSTTPELERPKPLLESASLRVIVERNTNSTTVMAVVLPDDQLALQLPESRIVI
jgi:hypothetical protein